MRRASSELLPTIMRMIATGEATSRAGIAKRIDLARSTVGLAVEALLDRGFLSEEKSEESNRGRPTLKLSLGPSSGVVGIIDFRDARSHVGVGDLSGRILARSSFSQPLEAGPGAALEVAVAALKDLHSTSGAAGLKRVIIGVQAPVNKLIGTVERPTSPGEQGRYAITSWESYPIAHQAEALLGVPAVLENDVNLMALRDARTLGRDRVPLLRLHLSLGIGSAIVDERGQLFRGVGGTAGDIGHLVVYPGSAVTCWCGKTGCIGAIGTLQPILDALDIDHRGVAAEEAFEILRARFVQGDPDVRTRVLAAATATGELLAMTVDLLNPATLVLSGEMIHLGSEVLAKIRSVVYERALSISTRHLHIAFADPDDDGLMQGAAYLGADALLDDQSLFV